MAPPHRLGIQVQCNDQRYIYRGGILGAIEQHGHIAWKHHCVLQSGETIKALRYPFGPGYVQLCGQQAILENTNLLLVRLRKDLGDRDASGRGMQPLKGSEWPTAFCVTKKATRSQALYELRTA